MQQTRYKVDLRAYHHECEQNYLRLLKLLPPEQNRACFQLQMPDNQRSEIEAEVVERCKYTTLVRLVQKVKNRWLDDKQFDLRIYHDAHMVEITAFQQRRRIQPSYAYPNPQMYQPDEKLQQQRFLSECLSYCLEHGLSLEAIPSF